MTWPQPASGGHELALLEDLHARVVVALDGRLERAHVGVDVVLLDLCDHGVNDADRVLVRCRVHRQDLDGHTAFHAFLAFRENQKRPSHLREPRTCVPIGSLRWHYPDQVNGRARGGTPLSRRAPAPVSIVRHSSTLPCTRGGRSSLARLARGSSCQSSLSANDGALIVPIVPNFGSQGAGDFLDRLGGHPGGSGSLSLSSPHVTSHPRPGTSIGARRPKLGDTRSNPASGGGATIPHAARLASLRSCAWSIQ